ncbi:MAG: DUF2855 family protein [Pseudomonadota bacterium]
MTRQHQISKTDLATTRWIDGPVSALGDGEVRLSIDAFALTANNVTYASFGGEPMHYWAFFPTGDPADEPGWGRVPVWGFATVAESKAEGVAEGQRVYGYLPISDELVVNAAKVSGAGFMDGSAHRAGLSPIYNTYQFTGSDPAYDAGFEAAQMLFRPLYATGWWLADTLTEASETSLATVIASSASSKTALAMAHALKSRGTVQLVGLTSAANADYVRGTGLYAETLTYDQLSALNSAPAPAAYVDFRGDPALTAGVHAATGEGLVRSLVVGATAWDVDRTPKPLVGPTPDFFFVPDVAAARIAAVGPSLMATLNEDLRAFYPASARYCTPTEATGTSAVDAAWAAAVAGSVPADVGQILRLG